MSTSMRMSMIRRIRYNKTKSEGTSQKDMLPGSGLQKIFNLNLNAGAD